MLEIADILEATHGVLVSEGANKFSGISIDSRTVKKGELFVALKGERFDGHDFVHASLRTCAGALVSRAWARDGVSSLEGKAIIAVENPLSALQDVARSIRNKFRGPVIAVVGSNGKTTTKELISSILGTTFNVLKTEGNLNNHVGMPLSMTKAVPETEAMVLEMGTNRPGDVDQLCRIAFPDTAVITNIGYEHIEGFGSLEAVRDAELEIIPYVNKVVLNGDDNFLAGGISLKFTGPVVTFGIENNECDVTARDIFFDETGSRFAIDISGKSASVDSRLSGRFNIYNSLAACAAAHSIGIDLDKIKKGLEAFGGVGMRFEIRRVGGITYLFDAYNANPSSMKASIRELSRIARGNAEKPGNIRAIAVLGDMLELGDYGKAAHEELGRLLSELGIDLLIGAGPLMTGAVSVFGLSG
ncbi:MAG TPA: UDP-N-acetylmuramoyl-tripeptide--D-alanyl-D-alanine ligase, partial [Dissulfurispiraceae bacterium]|nr:UDP-N-acetylmuramoyl-tripeptide--D-alanyl-D-alanine ligase [Dissulfurispiraceae bacterium]